MFSIYNNGSVTFRSTADNLYELKNIDQSAESRHKPDDDLIHDFSQSNKKDKKPITDAIKAYKKVVNISSNERVYHIKDIMSKKTISILENSTIEDAYNILKKYKISQIAVVSKNNKIISMISKKIILNILMEDITKSTSIINKRLNSLNLPRSSVKPLALAMG